MRLTFSAKYRVGDKVQVLPGEHNFNWQGKVGEVVDVGIDLHTAAYIVEFADEIFKPCFLKEDLRLVKRKGIRSDATESSLTRSLSKAIKSAPVPSQSCFCLVFGLATADFDEKRRWFDSKVRYQWFNNIVASLTPPTILNWLECYRKGN